MKAVAFCIAALLVAAPLTLADDSGEPADNPANLQKHVGCRNPARMFVTYLIVAARGLLCLRVDIECFEARWQKSVKEEGAITAQRLADRWALFPLPILT